MYEMVETNVLLMLVRVRVFSKQELALERRGGKGWILDAKPPFSL
jgi:hypothetical protein